MGDKPSARRTILPGGSAFLEHYFIDVAPEPVFSRLDGLHNGVLRGVKMLGGMFVLR